MQRTVSRPAAACIRHEAIPEISPHPGRHGPHPGALACYIILLGTAPEPTSLAAYASVRQGIAAIGKWLLLPSLVIVLASGLLSIAAHRPFMSARWTWLKAVLGLSMFEGTLVGIQGPAEHAAIITNKALIGELDPGRVPELLHDEWRTLWFILGLAVVNVVLAIWRPGLRWKQLEH